MKLEDTKLAMITRYPTTVADVATFLQAFFPVRLGDVPFLYHRPFSPTFSAHRFNITSIVLSITPTEGFYNALTAGTKLGFLHRPFELDRRSVPRFGTILSCHKGLDEVLTVGYNPTLAQRLGLDVETSAVIQGYKGDPERRIGIVARFANGGLSTEVARQMICREFNDTTEGSFGFDETVGKQFASALEHPILGIAIMNAFHPEEIDRVLQAAVAIGIPVVDGKMPSLIYLTGAVRELGLAAALECSMKVICVGHRTCEEWGIRYLADQLRLRFPDLLVQEIYEDEPPRPPKIKKNVVEPATGPISTT